MEEDIKILEEFFKDRMDVEEEKWALKNLIHDLEYNKAQFATQLREKLDLRADSIPKSKVKEKIEHLKSFKGLVMFKKYNYEAIIRHLQELIEESNV